MSIKKMMILGKEVQKTYLNNIEYNISNFRYSTIEDYPIEEYEGVQGRWLWWGGYYYSGEQTDYSFFKRYHFVTLDGVKTEDYKDTDEPIQSKIENHRYYVYINQKWVKTKLTDGQITTPTLTFIHTDGTEETIEIPIGAIGKNQKYTARNDIKEIECNNILDFAEGTFYDCDNLEKITFNETINIRQGVINGCEKLREVHFQNTIEYIGYDVFTWMPSDAIIYYEGTVREWEDIARPTNWVDNVYDDITVMCSDGSTTLKTTVIRNPIDYEPPIEMNYPTSDNEIWYTTTNDEKFDNTNCTMISTPTLVSNTYENGHGVLTYSNDVTEILEDGFYNGEGLQLVSLPNTCTKIGYHAFNSTRSIKGVNLAEDTNDIGRDAFSWSKLIGIKIPKTVTAFRGAFLVGTDTLSSIVYGGTKAEFDAIQKDSGWNDQTGNYKIVCTDGVFNK